MLASSYPLLDLFWTMLEIFAFVIWIWLLFIVFADIFRSHDMGGGAKAGWIILVILLPLIGVLIYLIARGSKMAQHAAEDAQRQDAAFRDYVKQVQTDDGSGTADELGKLADLKARGVITDQEFEQQKAKLLAGS